MEGGSHLIKGVSGWGVTLIWHKKVYATRDKRKYIFEMLSSLNASCKNALFYPTKYYGINLWV